MTARDMFAGGYCAGMGLGGWLLMIGFWAGFVGLVVWAITRLFPSRDRRGDAEHALDRRLASGEIDPQTYRQVREPPTPMPGARRSRRTSVLR
ncbi:MAG TPA: hypothetical protein VIJ07_21580 [Dermatophilaceae bacterium]